MCDAFSNNFFSLNTEIFINSLTARLDTNLKSPVFSGKDIFETKCTPYQIAISKKRGSGNKCYEWNSKEATEDPARV